MSDEELEQAKTDTDSYLTTYQLIQTLETLVKMSKKMDLLSAYIMSDIEFKKNRSELYKRIVDNLTGLFLIGAITKLGSIVIGLIFPFIFDFF